MYEAFLFLLACVPLVVWQSYRRYARTPEELKTNELQKLYAGQDRFPGSKASNDEARSNLLAAGEDLSSTMKIRHSAQTVGFRTPIRAEDLSAILSDRGFQVEDRKTEEQLNFTADYTLSSMVFDRKTAELNDFLFKHGWQYKGWNCPAKNGDDKHES
ncbi:MAG: ribonuclease E inhibitor RraB [Pseudomonadota bacterium]